MHIKLKISALLFLFSTFSFADNGWNLILQSLSSENAFTREEALNALEIELFSRREKSIYWKHFESPSQALQQKLNALTDEPTFNALRSAALMARLGVKLEHKHYSLFVDALKDYSYFSSKEKNNLLLGSQLLDDRFGRWRRAAMAIRLKPIKSEILFLTLVDSAKKAQDFPFLVIPLAQAAMSIASTFPQWAKWHLELFHFTDLLNALGHAVFSIATPKTPLFTTAGDTRFNLPLPPQAPRSLVIARQTFRSAVDLKFASELLTGIALENPTGIIALLELDKNEAARSDECREQMAGLSWSIRYNDLLGVFEP